MKWYKDKDYFLCQIKIKGIGEFVLHAYKIDNEDSFAYEIDSPSQEISKYVDKFTKKEAKNIEEAKHLCEKAFREYIKNTIIEMSKV